MSPRSLTGALALALSLVSLPALAEIEVHDPYLLATTPGSPTAAAFMVIHNHGGAPDRLIAVQSAVAARTELHTHQMTADGVMQMIEVEEGFDLPTDGEIVMERGGHHVMFLGLTEPLTDGATIPLTLVFETAGEVPVTVTVDLDGSEHGGAAEGHEGHAGH